MLTFLQYLNIIHINDSYIKVKVRIGLGTSNFNTGYSYRKMVGTVDKKTNANCRSVTERKLWSPA